MRQPKMQLRRVQVLCVLVLLLSLLPLTALADPGITVTNFKDKWQRADKPVGDGVVARSWLWGPETFSPPSGNTEPYAGGTRQVLYFDKARMEINDSTNGFVTNGLLVRELISGRLATGDATFTQRRAADDIPVAGDPTNNAGPTYASFTNVASLNGDNGVNSRINAPVSDSLNKDGSLGTASSDLSSKAKYVYFDASLRHNVPDVFWTFMNQRGTIYENGQFVKDQPVLGINPAAPWLDANGLPITEAYWAKVTLAGQSKDVLIQAFERRVLTYTPSNPPAFQVEMGNVGRHYFSWRYDAKYDQITPPPPPASSCDSLPVDVGGAFTFIRCGPAGMEIVAAARGMQAGENVVVDYTRGDGSQSERVTAARADGLAEVVIGSSPTSPQGKWTFSFKGQMSGKVETAYFFLQPPLTQPTIIVYPNPARLDQDVTILLVGFGSSEGVAVLLQSPVANAPLRGFVGNVSEGGGLTTLLQIRNVYPQEFQTPGNWNIYVFKPDGSAVRAKASFVVVK